MKILIQGKFEHYPQWYFKSRIKNVKDNSPEMVKILLIPTKMFNIKQSKKHQKGDCLELIVANVESEFSCRFLIT